MAVTSASEFPDSRPVSPARRTGGRSARVRARVHTAVRDLLVEGGFDGLSVGAVAERSGTHRTTIYRRWGGVAELLADVLAAGRDDDWSPSDTGSLYGDLLALNQEVFTGLCEDPVTTALIAASFRSDVAARALRAFWEERHHRCAPIVVRAAERGELPPLTDARRLIVAATAPLYHELLLLRSHPDPTLARFAAQAATLAGAAGAFLTEHTRGSCP